MLNYHWLTDAQIFIIWLSFMENDNDCDAEFKEGERNMANTEKQHMVFSELITGGEW